MENVTACLFSGSRVIVGFSCKVGHANSMKYVIDDALMFILISELRDLDFQMMSPFLNMHFAGR